MTALGIKRSEKSVGYATQKVDGSKLTEAPEMNIINSLNGRVSGVQITNSSGAVGSSSRIQLRGASSIFGSTQPLFIVDGIPIDNSNTGSSDGNGGFDIPNGIADINPNDIESMDILKGPNAAALYGIRASNGVIVINTKKGTKSKSLGVELTSSLTFETPLVLPSFQNSYGQGSSSTSFTYINGSSGDGGVDESWGPPLDVGLKFMQFTSYILDPENPQPQPWVSHPNNVRDFYETGLTSSNNISFTGGNDVATFRLGFGYTDQKGMIPYTDFNKYSVSGSGSYDLSKKLKANLNFNYVKSTSNNLPSSGYDGSNVVQQTIWSGRNVDLQALADYENLPKALAGSTYGAGTLPISWNTRFQNNPYWQLATNRNTFDRDRFFGSAGLSYAFTDYLTLSGNIGLDNYTTLTTTRFAKGSAADAPTYWRFGGNRSTEDGYYDEDLRRFNEVNANFLLDFNKELSNDFELSLNFGGNAMKRKTTFDFRAIQLELPDLYNLANIKSGTSLFNLNNHAQSAINSLYGAGELAFRKYLFLGFTARNDWASVLPLENNSFFYPSVTLSADLTEALDLYSNTLNFLKVRLGWAEVGGFGPLGPSDILSSYSQSANPWNGVVFGSYPSTLNNPNLKSQTTYGLEGGVDARLFNNKLRFSFTYYDQTSKDLIIPVQVTRSSGVSYVWDNIGELRNKGVEIQLGTTVYDKKDLTVNFEFNFSKNNNKVLKAGKDDEATDETLLLGSTWNMNLEAKEGYAYGVIVGTSLARDDDGNVIYENGLPVIGETKVFGDIQPDWVGGVGLDVNYKLFTFNALVDAKIGGEVYSMTNAWGRYSGILAETVEGRETGIVGKGVMLSSDGTYVTNNVVVDAESFNRNAYGSEIVETSVFDASYVKLRQLSFGVNLPKKMFKSFGIQNVNLSFIGRI
ncbi:MAG: SusC/RagA family TonB-linked outer membrane protein [Saprospiraceae bacterium]